jgi:uncharacterized RDD family membrane protein YckC
MINTHYDLSGLPDPEADQQFYTGVPFKRFLAWIIDFSIIMLIAAAGVIATFGLGAFMFPLMLLCINLGYRIFTLSRNSATLGMIITGIEIRNHRGDKLNITEAAWHTCIYTVVMIFFFGLIITAIMMLVNKRGQGLHDYFLGTTAINRPRKS